MNKWFIILVTGGRNFAQRDRLEGALVKITQMHDKPLIIHGKAKSGADRMAERWCEKNGVQQVMVPANWNGPAGKGAGPQRNRLMLELVKPHYFLAFPDLQSIGTYDMVDLLTTAKVPGEIYHPNLAFQLVRYDR